MTSLTNTSALLIITMSTSSFLSIIALAIIRLPTTTTSSLVTSCTGVEEEWRREGVGVHLRSWLRSGVTVVEEGEVHSRLYDPTTQVWSS